MTDIPRNVLIQHPSGKLISDHREEGKNLMRRAGVDPDAPLDIDWTRAPDRRDNRNAEEIGQAILAKRAQPKIVETNGNETMRSCTCSLGVTSIECPWHGGAI
jgi:hypothetical protein